jgi:ubiquitin carboxyl-terminal hydrolase L5
VALLNIIMNVEGLDLGDHLRDFRAATTYNTFVRTTHNSVSRRMDFLNSDLWIQNEEGDAQAKKQKKRKQQLKKAAGTPKNAPKKRSRKKAPSTESGYHFVAYVPSGGAVWELDGLKTKPVWQCAVGDVDWTFAVGPRITERMRRYEERAKNFNLLAVCKSPCTGLSGELAENVRCFELLRAHVQGPEWEKLVGEDAAVRTSRDDDRLAEYGLTSEDVESATVVEAFAKELAGLGPEPPGATDLWQGLSQEQSRIIGKYHVELASVQDDDRTVSGRKKDFTLAIHAWVKMLAEKGLLEHVAVAAAAT